MSTKTLHRAVHPAIPLPPRMLRESTLATVRDAFDRAHEQAAAWADASRDAVFATLRHDLDLDEGQDLLVRVRAERYEHPAAAPTLIITRIESDGKRTRDRAVAAPAAERYGDGWAAQLAARSGEGAHIETVRDGTLEPAPVLQRELACVSARFADAADGAARALRDGMLDARDNTDVPEVAEVRADYVGARCVEPFVHELVDRDGRIIWELGQPRPGDERFDAFIAQVDRVLLEAGASSGAHDHRQTNSTRAAAFRAVFRQQAGGRYDLQRLRLEPVDAPDFANMLFTGEGGEFDVYERRA
ncbi:MAG: hypothetical protein ACTH0V_00395 [Microbacteriaceae bacterium]